MILFHRNVSVLTVILLGICGKILSRTKAVVALVDLDRRYHVRQQLHRQWAFLRGGGGRKNTDENYNQLRQWNVYFDLENDDDNDERVYDRYAVCLAATEGLRRHRDESIRHGDPNAESKYVHDAHKVLSAFGMTVEEYNRIGATLLSSSSSEQNKENDLKQRVMEQANLYRIASLVNEDSLSRKPSNSEKMTSHHVASSQQILQNTSPETLAAFLKSVNEIEILRRHQLEHLHAVVHSDSTNDGQKHPSISPAGIGKTNAVLHQLCAPVMRPYLNPHVRNIIESFPISAETIVQRHGLEPEEFNTLLREIQINPHFRQNIQKCMKQE